jgi:DNA polymerase-3 subunit alpha
MKYTNFINYSTYSNGLGLLKLEDIIKINKQNNSEHAVITDHMTCMAFPEFNAICLKNDLKPVFGLSVSISGEDGNLILIAKNDSGIGSLRNIVTNQKFDEYNVGYTTWEDINKFSNNLIAISGNKNSIVNSAFKSGNVDNLLNQLKSTFSKNQNNMLLDIQDRHGNGNALTDMVFRKSIELKLNVIATSTNRVFKPNHIPLLKQKLVSQISSKAKSKKEITTLDWEKYNLFDDDFAKTTSFMYGHFLEENQALFIENTTKITNSIQDYTVFKEPSFPAPNDLNLRAELNDIWVNFSKKLSESDKVIYQKRLESELNIIENLELEDYFKTYKIMADHAKSSDVAFAIRGSGSSSLVVHMLGISSIDPVKNGLLFERFLNYKRAKAGALPDIDFDTSDQGQICSKLSETFGENNIATLTNTDSIQKSNVSLELVSKALKNHANIDNEKSLNSLNSSMKEIFGVITLGDYGMPLSEEMKTNWRIKKLYSEKKEAKYIIDSALVLEGQITTHKRNSASVIVSKDNISNHLSVRQNPDALVSNVAEISKSFAESVGFIKLDVLSNHFIGHNLAAYRSLNMEDELYKEEYNDPKVFDLFKKGHLFSLFQMTKIGMNLSKEMKPEKFSDIVVLLGLIRPGVPKSEIADFINTKNKKEKLNFEIKELDSILSQTYGVIIFEEQLMRISQDIGGFSPDESDELRRTIKNKDKDKLAVIRTHFVKRGVKKNPNYSEKALNEVFSKIESKADGYMFNQAHAIVYADICYKQARIKANFPGEYLNFYLKDNKKKAAYIEESIDRGVYFNSPNINKSSAMYCTVSDARDDVKSLGIMPSLNTLVGEHFCKIILSERLNCPYSGLFDFTSRVINKSLENENLTVFDINETNISPRITVLSKNISSLVTVGFLDSFSKSQNTNDIVDFRNSALASIEKAVSLTLNPYIEGEFVFDKPLSVVSLDKFIEIESKSFGLSPLSIFKNTPISNNDLEKKRNKKGSLYDLI